MNEQAQFRTIKWTPRTTGQVVRKEYIYED